MGYALYVVCGRKESSDANAEKRSIQLPRKPLSSYLAEPNFIVVNRTDDH